MAKANLPPRRSVRTWLEISTKALERNLRVFKSLIGPKVGLLGVVKSNAYGHGLVETSKHLANFGADWLGVDTMPEGAKLRKFGLKLPILVFGHTLPANFKPASAQKISLSVTSFENLKALLRSKHKVRIHLKADTGMHRQGFLAGQMPEALRLISQTKNLLLEGFYTHFAMAEFPARRSETNVQIAEFNRLIHLARKLNSKIIVHAANTAATMNYPDARYNMVRVGGGLYGLWPSAALEKKFKNQLSLRPVLSWKTQITEIKPVAKGEGVGYDFREKARRDSLVAVMPVGYWQGLGRNFSKIGKVLVRGQKAKILGNVSMDMACINITGIPNCRAGDEVVIIGEQNGKKITADDWARLGSTINYEITTRINPLIKKYFV